MNNKNYEELFKELSEIVNKLQTQDVDLDNSIELFKRGVEIKKQCLSILNDAQEEVVKILNDDNTLEVFDEE